MECGARSELNQIKIISIKCDLNQIIDHSKKDDFNSNHEIISTLFFANKVGNFYHFEQANRQKCILGHFLGKVNKKMAYFSKNREVIRLRRDILLKICLIMNSK